LAGNSLPSEDIAERRECRKLEIDGRHFATGREGSPVVKVINQKFKMVANMPL
jgi:hypothetical protein